MGFTIVTYLTKYSFHKNLPNIINSKLYSVATTKDLWGREHFQTYNTLPYYESVTKKNIQTKTPEPIWVYFNKNHPLARSHDMTHFLNGHPFVQELLLNGAVCEDIYE